MRVGRVGDPYGGQKGGWEAKFNRTDRSDCLDVIDCSTKEKGDSHYGGEVECLHPHHHRPPAIPVAVKDVSEIDWYDLYASRKHSTGDPVKLSKR